MKIHSRPSGATVLLDGQPIGVTPMTTTLRTTEVHQIELQKPFFTPLAKRLRAGQDPERDGYVRFGALVDAGHYRSFGDEPIELVLQSELLPQSLGAEPLTTFSERILLADNLLETNQIDAETHQLIVEQIIGYFE